MSPVALKKESEHRAAIGASSAKRKSPTFVEQVRNSRVAYLSIPNHLQSPELVSAVRRTFSNMRVATFATFIKTKTQWRRRLADYISKIDLLIIATDKSRIITRGVLREIGTARAAKKLLIIFNASTSRWERYYGFDLVEQGDRKVRVLRISPARESAAQGGNTQ